jgi:hypothetical protein
VILRESPLPAVTDQGQPFTSDKGKVAKARTVKA